jgi:hypothetical protein
MIGIPLGVISTKPAIVAPPEDYNGMVFSVDMTGADGSSTYVDDTGRQAPIAGTPLATGAGKGLFYPSCAVGINAGCYLKTNDSNVAKSDFVFPDEFYIEFSYKATITNAQHAYPMGFLLADGETLSPASPQRGYIRFASNGIIHFHNTDPNSALISGGLIRLNVWTTIRLFRLGGVIYLYQDNDLIGSIVNTDVFGVGQMWFGTISTGGNALKGLMQKIRVWRGINAPGIGWTLVQQLLFNGTNGQTTFTDSTGRHSPVRTGTCTNSTSQKVEGTASLLIPIGNNRLAADNAFPSNDFIFPGDFDIWFDSRTGNGSVTHVLMAFMPPDGTGLNGDPTRLVITSSTYGSIVVTNGDGSIYLSAGTVFAGQWNSGIHLFRRNGVLYLIASEYSGYTVSQPYVGDIGCGYLVYGSEPSTGNNPEAFNIDNVSIRKGI